jgi:hypothetical protein
MSKTLMENDRIYTNSPMPDFKAFTEKSEVEVFEIARKFLRPLENYFRQNALPEEHEVLLERLNKASIYFSAKLEKELLPMLKNIAVITDNKSVKGKTLDGLEAIEKAIFVKNAAFKIAKEGFDVQAYIKAKANADIDFNQYKRQQKTAKKLNKVPSDVEHPQLYAQLLQWREETAAINSNSDYEVLPMRSLQELVKFLPTTKKNLKKISGIGEIKLKMYGETLIDMIEAYSVSRGLMTNTMKIPFSKNPTKTKKRPTKEVTLEMFDDGKTVDEIAEERTLTANTIFNHLAHYVGLGDVDISELMEKKDIADIQLFFVTNQTTSKSEAKTYFGEKYSYSEIGMVVQHLNAQE